MIQNGEFQIIDCNFLLKDFQNFVCVFSTTQNIVDFMDNEDKMGFEKKAKGKKGK